jgi:hypothetical protein
MAANPGATLEDFEKAYVSEHFGIDEPGFFAAAGRLAKRGLFNYAADLGFFKDARPAPLGYVAARVEEMAKTGELEKELADCERRLGEYRQGLDLLRAYQRLARSGRGELDAWVLASRNLINRAEASKVLLTVRRGRAGPEAKAEAVRILAELRSLRRETETAVAAKIKPSRTAEIMSWMYGSMEAALASVAGGDAAESRR